MVTILGVFPPSRCISSLHRKIAARNKNYMSLAPFKTIQRHVQNAHNLANLSQKSLYYQCHLKFTSLFCHLHPIPSILSVDSWIFPSVIQPTCIPTPFVHGIIIPSLPACFVAATAQRLQVETTHSLTTLSNSNSSIRRSLLYNSTAIPTHCIGIILYFVIFGRRLSENYKFTRLPAENRWFNRRSAKRIPLWRLSSPERRDETPSRLSFRPWRFATTFLLAPLLPYSIQPTLTSGGSPDSPCSGHVQARL